MFLQFFTYFIQTDYPLKVFVPSGPIVIKEEGTSVTLTCNVEYANPPANSYTWYMKIGDKTTEIASGQSITFTLNSYSAGDYLCEAKNRIGSKTSSRVHVSYPGSLFVDLVVLTFLKCI